MILSQNEKILQKMKKTLDFLNRVVYITTIESEYVRLRTRVFSLGEYPLFVQGYSEDNRYIRQ